MAKEIKSKPGLMKAYDTSSEDVKEYFEYLPKLLDEFPMEVCLAYAFARLELGQNMALYCGAVKVHRANTDLARTAVSSHHMTREGYVRLYKTVFGFGPPKTAHRDLKTAESTRDDVMHGKKPGEDRIRNAVARVLEYAEAVNRQLLTKHGLNPFGSLTGFSGRATKLDKGTTRFLLKGMGFDLR